MHAADASAEPPAAGQAVAPSFHVRAYAPAPRLLSAVFQGVIAADLLLASFLVSAFTFNGAMNPMPPGIAGWLVLLALVLYGLLQVTRWLSAATFTVEPSRFVLERRGDRFEIPVASVESIRVWRLPLPGAGLSLRMKSGRAFQYSVQVADTKPLLEAMARENPTLPVETRHPLAAFAHARATSFHQRWYFRVLEFGLFPLVTGTIVFQLNQRITFGGPFAQYHMYGLGPYLRSFFTYWAALTSALLLFATPWRVLAELVALVGAWISPPHARGVRRFAEIAWLLLYFGGFSAVMAQFIGW